MCGILYTKLKSPYIDRTSFISIFEQALDLMSYRGPDARGVKIVNDHYFGHVRLSIVDLSDQSNQPVEDDNHIMIFNGEIYNYKTIEPESSSDTRTLFKIMKNESNPFEKIRGMFAFGWFEKKTEKITFYRDFFGEKPLYYYNDDEICIVSSTLKSITYILKKIGKIVKINKRAIEQDFLLFGYIRSPETIWEGIMEVPPGHCLDITNGCTINSLFFNIRSSSYEWNSSDYIKNTFLSSDVSGTLLLSGGIDSTFLLSKAVEENIPLQIGIYKAETKEIDESETAFENIKKMKINAKDFPLTVLSSNEIKEIDIDDFVKILEQPTSDGLNVFHLLKHLKKDQRKLKLVYTGLGGDELFGGYPTFYNFKLICVLLRIPFSDAFFPVLRRFKKGRDLLDQWDPDVYSFLYRINFNEFITLQRKGLSLKAIFEKYKKSLLLVPQEVSIQNFNPMMLIKKNETFMYGNNQLMRDNDNIAMHLGLESRSPLLNPDWYNQLPDKKNRLKNNLRSKFNIVFGKKRGFTLDETLYKKKYIDYIRSNENCYEKINIHVPNDLNSKHLRELRAFAILGGWLKYNNI